MHYVVFDLEFNQDFSSFSKVFRKRSQYPFEIIQIGAVKLDSNFNYIGKFNRYIKPTMYSNISQFITELTGITNEKLEHEESFDRVYKSFINFLNDDTIFCTWGLSDVKELYKNAIYHSLNTNLLPRSYINIQPYLSRYLGLSSKKLIRLQSAVELLNIEMKHNFHDALNDAYYTAEILKKIYSPLIHPKIYDPHFVKPRPQKRKETVDYDALISQFNKMYNGKLSDKELEMIKLAYNMGRTRQFIK